MFRFYLACLILIFASCQTWAGNTVFTPEVTVGTLHDDNIRLDEEADEAWETVTSIRGKLTNKTETGLMMGDFRWENFSYQGGDGLDNRNDYKLKLKGRTNQERSVYQLDLMGIQDTTAKDIAVEDDGDIGGDVGFVRDDIKRNRFYIMPSWGYSLSEISVINLRYKYSDLQYDDSKGTDLVDGFNHNVTGKYSVKTSEKNTFEPSLSVNHYESEGGKNYEFIVARMSNERVYDEHFSSYASLGYYFIDAETDKVSEKADSGLYEIGGLVQSDNLSLNFKAERVLAPGDSGNIIAKDQYSLGLLGEINPTWDYQLGARYYRNRPTIKEISNNNRRYLSFKASLLWQFTESFDLDFGYRYREERDQEEGDDTQANSNAFFITLRYVNDLIM